MPADLFINIDGTSAAFDRAASNATKSAIRVEAALKAAASAAADYDAAVAEAGAGSAKAVAAQDRYAASLKRSSSMLERDALLTKQLGEIQTAEAAKAASASEAMAARQAVALKKVGTVYGAIGTAAALSLGLAAKAASDFDAKMALVGTLSHASAADVQKLASAAHDYANIGYSASDAADAEAELVKAGISVQDILSGGLKASLTLAAAGQIDVASATSIAAQAMTQFQLKGKDLPHIADLLSAGADKALGSVQDLGDALSYSGLAAHQFGIPIEQTVGTLAEFAQAGLIGSKGGAAFQQMLRSLQKPSAEASALMQQLGIHVYDAQGNFVGLAGIAGQLHDKLSGLTQAQRDTTLATLFGSRSVRGAMVLYQGGAQAVQEWTNKVNDSGFAMGQATGKLNSSTGDWAKFKAQLDNTAIDLGQQLQPALRDVLQTATGFLHVFSGLPGPVKSIAVEFGILVAALGAGVYVFTRISGAIANMRAQLAALRGQEVATAATGAATNEGAGVGGFLGGPLSKRGLALQGGLLLGSTAAEYGASKLGGGTTGAGTGLNILGGAATGAAIGSFGGPPGMAIGAGVGAVVGGIQSLAQASSAAAAAQQQLDTAAHGVALALNQQTGAVTSATQATLHSTLQQQGAFEAADSLGLSYGAVTKAALGQIPVQALLGHATGGNLQAYLKLSNVLTTTSKKIDDQRAKIQRNADAQVVAGQSVQRMGSAVDEEGHSFQATTGKVLTAKQTMDQYSGATKAALKNAIALDNEALGKKGDWANYRQSILAVTQGLKQNGRTLDVNTAKGYANFQNLQNQAQMAAQYASTLHVGSAAWLTFMTKSRAALLDSAKNLGYSDAKAKAYVDTVLSIPTDWKTKADFDTVDAMRKLHTWQQAIEGLRNKTVFIDLKLRESQSGSGGHVVSEFQGLASGTPDWRGGYAMVGEHGRELVELPAHARVYPAPQTAAMLSGIPSFARGGVMGVASTPRADGGLAKAITALSVRIDHLAARGSGVTFTGDVNVRDGRDLMTRAQRARQATADLGVSA